MVESSLRTSVVESKGVESLQLYGPIPIHDHPVLEPERAGEPDEGTGQCQEEDEGAHGGYSVETLNLFRARLAHVRVQFIER